MRLSLLALVALAACTSPATEALPLASTSGAPSAPADSSRAAAAGLDAGQAEALAAVAVPVYVPMLPAGWFLVGMEADPLHPVDPLPSAAEYSLRYQTDTGACLTLEAASEGLGDVFMDEPAHVREVALPGVPAAGPALLGWGAAGDAAEGWEGGRVATEWFGMDGLALRLETPEGCAPVSPDEAAAFLAALRPLDPADDAIVLGPVATVDDGLGAAPGPEPEAVALAAFGPVEAGEGREQTTVETLRRRDRFAVVLVTTTNQADDSVRDTRTRVTLVRPGDLWEILSGGTQQRCQPGRGQAEWSAEMCR